MSFLRKRFFSHPLLNYVRRNLPPMSITEKIALDAGDVWWDGDLFSGKPNWQKLHQFPKAQLNAEEQAFLDGPIETLCQMLNDWEIVHTLRDLPKVAWDYLKQERFFGIAISKEYGGLGFSAVAHSTIVSKIASRSLSAAITTMVPNSLGPAELLQHYGTKAQKDFYLPRLARGQDIPCFALTGVEMGSDAGAMPDNGVVCYKEFEGQKVLGIRLNWEKRYITLAPVATVLGLAFKLQDPDHLLGQKENIGITLCLIPTNHPGVEIGARHVPLHMAFMNGTTRGHDVFVPMDWIIGGVEMAGHGWRMLMECLSIGRGISLPALSAGSSKLSYRMTGAYARVRRQFKQPIGNFEGVAESLARIGGLTYLVEATRLLTASAIDLKIKPTVASAIAKYHLTELCRQVVNDAMDVHAGRGIQLGPRNYLGLTYEGLPISITVEGANILTRNLIIFGQGAMRCHPYLRDEVAAANDENKEQGLNKFDQLLKAHVKFSLGNFGRTIFYSWFGRKNDYYRQLSRFSAALAFTADLTLLILGGDLKRKEMLSARLGDVLSYLYLSSAVLKYYRDQGELAEDKVYVDWALQFCLQKIEHAFDQFLINFPKRSVAFLLRAMIFPLGQKHRGPKDADSLKIAQSMLAPSAQRDRLTQYCYINKDKDDVTGRMENALEQCICVEAIKAKKSDTLTAQEVQILKDYEVVRLDAIQVDEFK